MMQPLMFQHGPRNERLLLQVSRGGGHEYPRTRPLTILLAEAEMNLARAKATGDEFWTRVWQEQVDILHAEIEKKKGNGGTNPASQAISDEGLPIPRVAKGYVRAGGRLYGPFASRKDMIHWAESHPAIARVVLMQRSLTAPAYLYFGESTPTLYHVTATTSVPRILKEGLRPLRAWERRLFGRALRKGGELPPPGVYLTADPRVIDHVVDYSTSELRIEGPFSIIEIQLPRDWPLIHDRAFGFPGDFFAIDAPAQEVGTAVRSSLRVPTGSITRVADFDTWILEHKSVVKSSWVQ